MNNSSIPIIDLFAGPGGLGEGFSSMNHEGHRPFDIKLSIEKDDNAHKTLQLRSFYRKFSPNNLPEEYYRVLRENDLAKREDLIEVLFDKYPEEAEKAKNETWKVELGNKNFPSETIDNRIKNALGSAKDWLLIGGPPCQAYSLAGRSRVGGISNDDHRVYLYKEYLRIIAVHHPSMFVMENVMGLLSAEVNGKKVFDWILKDLQDPSSVFNNTNSPKYRIYSLSTAHSSVDDFGNPIYNDPKDFLIQSEKYGVPQKRHRIILLGIREDMDLAPSTLSVKPQEIKLKNVIGDLPKIRSGLGRSIISSETINGRKKRVYRKEVDSIQNWEALVNNFKSQIFSWNGFSTNGPSDKIKVSKYGLGSEFIEFKTPSKINPLHDWYNDENLQGVCNHVARTHLVEDLKRYLFASLYAKKYKRFPRLIDYERHSVELMPDHSSAKSGKFADRFRVQMPDRAATTITSHISKDGHYFIHYDSKQCRSLTVREAARIQTFPDNYLFRGSRTAQYHQVGNAVPPYLAFQIAEIVFNIF